MTHSLHGGHDHGLDNGFTTLGKSIGTPNATDKDLAHVAEHPVLKYFRAKLANFLNDFRLAGCVVLLVRIRVKLDKKNGDGRSVPMDCDWESYH